jgi:putative restriction endonuclease
MAGSLSVPMSGGALSIWRTRVNPPTARVPWSHDELVVACGLYFTLPFGQMHSRNPKIIEVAGLLGRTPSSLAMKLVNFASLDPAHQARGVRGLAGHSRGDEQVWTEFHDNWDEMTVLSETKLQNLEAAQGPPAPEISEPEPEYVPRDVRTETAATVRVRTMQSFFRKVVLAAYNSRCCITGNPVEDLLVASHILPWSDFPEQRLNPKNGLCLAAHFDRAFDRRLITFDTEMRLVLSPVLKRYLPNSAIESEFVPREGQRLTCPDRFLPEADFLAYHRGRMFRME